MIFVPESTMRKIVINIMMAAMLLSPLLTLSQTDSTDNRESDSLLINSQEQTNFLLSSADSARFLDSIEQASLLEEISQLRQRDQKKKAELQAKLDSLKSVQTTREERIKEQVDSLKLNTPGIPVIVFDDTLFFIYSKLGPFKPSDRAASICQKVEFLVDEELFKPENLRIVAGEESHDVFHNEMILFSITDRDAFWINMDRAAAAELHVLEIKNLVEDYKERTGLIHLLRRIGLLILVLVCFFLGIRYMNRGFTWLNIRILRKSDSFLNGIKIRNYELLSPYREKQVVIWILNALKWLIIIILIYLALPVLFSIFPATKGIAVTLIGYVLDPLKSIVTAIVAYIPELITIIVISFVFHNLVRLLAFLASEIESEKLILPGFYPDWAKSTFNILRIIIYAFAFIVIFPYLPGSDSPVFQGVSVFLGILLSLGSSSAISNIIAGLVMTYMRSFKIGDRVKIGDTTGDVIEKSMLITRLRTIKNEEVTIPNAAILNGSTTNYSASAKEMGLILNTTITIGYDVPWRKVHELLIEAALKSGSIEKEPKPFVFQTSLDDYYVSYQINAYTHYAGAAAKIYSELHSNIQDSFNEAGIEIMSPHYRANRDGNLIAIPPDYTPGKQQTPGFKSDKETKTDTDKSDPKQK